jgi:hypothetical protein
MTRTSWLRLERSAGAASLAPLPAEGSHRDCLDVRARGRSGGKLHALPKSELPVVECGGHAAVLCMRLAVRKEERPLEHVRAAGHEGVVDDEQVCSIVDLQLSRVRRQGVERLKPR